MALLRRGHGKTSPPPWLYAFPAGPARGDTASRPVPDPVLPGHDGDVPAPGLGHQEGHQGPHAALDDWHVLCPPLPGEKAGLDTTG